MDASDTAQELHPLRWPRRVAVISVLVGALAGVGWALLAPVEHLLAVGNGRGVLLTGESAHQFDAVALFLCVGAAVGAVSALAAWSSVGQRGPRMVVSVMIASVLGAGAMAGVGLLVGRVRYPSMPDAAAGDVVAFAPGVVTPLVLLAQPLAAAVALVLVTSLCGSDDLRGTDEADENAVASDDAGAPVSPAV